MSHRLEFANALRGLAALSVLVAHYFGVFWFSRDVAAGLANTTAPAPDVLPAPWIASVLASMPINLGPFGVALFFLISGFVIPYSFSRTNAARFLVGRFFRIYPLYFAGFTVTILALTISGAMSGRPFPFTLSQVAVHYVPGLRDLMAGPHIDWIVWTLEIELKFYLVCALVAPLLRAGSLWTFAIPAALFGMVTAFHDQPWGTYAKVAAHSSEYMVFMFIGVAFNFLFRRCIGPAAFAVIVAATLAAFFAGTKITGEPMLVMQSYAAAFVVFAAAASFAKSWPKVRVLSFLADISYPLYVVHGVLGYAILAHLSAAGVPPLLSISIATAAAISIAWGLHVTVEAWSHRLGQRLARREARLEVDPQPA